MKSFLLKLFILVISTYIIILFSHEIYVKFSNSYETQIIDVSILQEKSKAKGIIYKDEVILNSGYGNITKNMQPNGAKVSVNSNIVQIYDSKEDAQKYDRILKLREELKNLENIQNEKQSKNLNFAGVEKHIYFSYYNFLDKIINKNLNDVEDDKANLTSYLNMRETIINKNIDFNKSILKIKEEIAGLEKTVKMPKIIFSKETGYFVNFTDGLENICSINNIENLKFDKFKNFYENYNKYRKNSDKNVKIITSHNILFKAIMKTKDLSNRKINCDCKIKFKETDQEVEANLKNVYLNFNKEYSLAIFEILNMNEKLSSLRKAEADVIFKEFEGFKIPKEAVRNNSENETGVYIISGSNIKFKKISILFEDEDFVICSINPKNKSETSKYLKNLDKIIVKGRNIYENKKV